VVGQPAHGLLAPNGLVAGAQLPERADQGKRRQRQPDRDRRGRRLARDRYGKAIFDVEDYEQFVVVQSETAVRQLASKYPYDDYDAAAASLRGAADEILESLHTELQNRLQPAGIEVLETRLTHLAYAAEIAEVMLRRQQAEAILAARKKMVAGAVGIVQMALAQLADSDLVELDPERKAAMVSNLMVVLSGDHAPTPVLNTGTLYT